MKLIGISAHAARSGKDTLAKCLQVILQEKGKKAAIRSLAAPLKDRMWDFAYKEFDIDLRTCSVEEKEIMRPLMVAYGGTKRRVTNGQFWTGLMNLELMKLEKEGADYVVIPDLRYCEFDNDEVVWLKNKGGHLFFVSLILDDGSRLPPPNEDEAKNSPILEERADVKIEWPHMSFDECLVFVKNNFCIYEKYL